MDAWGYRVCYTCAGTHDDHGERPGRALNESLKNTDPNDL